MDVQSISRQAFNLLPNQHIDFQNKEEIVKLVKLITAEIEEKHIQIKFTFINDCYQEMKEEL